MARRRVFDDVEIKSIDISIISHFFVQLKSKANHQITFNIHGTVHRSMTSSNNQQDAT